jgi:hypothetical protein
MKCKHGLTEETCAVCKDWPSFDRMRNIFPDLTHQIFLVMTPTERVLAMKTGVIQ